MNTPGGIKPSLKLLTKTVVCKIAIKPYPLIIIILFPIFLFQTTPFPYHTACTKHAVILKSKAVIIETKRHCHVRPPHLQLFRRSRRPARSRIAYRAARNARLQRHRLPCHGDEPPLRNVPQHPPSRRTRPAHAAEHSFQLQNPVPARRRNHAIQHGCDEPGAWLPVRRGSGNGQLEPHRLRTNEPPDRCRNPTGGARRRTIRLYRPAARRNLGHRQKLRLRPLRHQRDRQRPAIPNRSQTFRRPAAARLRYVQRNPLARI